MALFSGMFSDGMVSAMCSDAIFFGNMYEWHCFRERFQIALFVGICADGVVLFIFCGMVGLFLVRSRLSSFQ